MNDYDRGVRDERKRVILLLETRKEWLFDHASPKEAEYYAEIIERISKEIFSG